MFQAQCDREEIGGSAEKRRAAFNLLRERYKTLKEMAEAAVYFFVAPSTYDEKAKNKCFNAVGKQVLSHLSDVFSSISWNEETIQETIRQACETLDLKFGKVASPLRLAVTGSSVSPPMAETLAVIGQEDTLMRLKAAIPHCLA